MTADIVRQENLRLHFLRGRYEAELASTGPRLQRLVLNCAAAFVVTDVVAMYLVASHLPRLALFAIPVASIVAIWNLYPFLVRVANEPAAKALADACQANYRASKAYCAYLNAHQAPEAEE